RPPRPAQCRRRRRRPRGPVGPVAGPAAAGRRRARSHRGAEHRRDLQPEPGRRGRGRRGALRRPRAGQRPARCRRPRRHRAGRVLGDEASAALRPPALLATLSALAAVTIADAIRPLGAGRVVASGGGMRNPLLRERLAALLAPVPLRDADDLGIPADGKEALLIALLGHHGAHGLPGTLARADGTAHTGARTPAVLGSLTPPHALRSLPREPGHEHAVDRLVIVTDDGEERS